MNQLAAVKGVNAELAAEIRRHLDLMSALLDHHRLHYLHEAIRRGSVRAAAEALDVNASVISRQIALLEQELGLTLVERLSRGIRATEAGALLVERFRHWQADQADTVAKLRELQGLKRGHVDIVLGEGFVSDLMSGISVLRGSAEG